MNCLECQEVLQRRLDGEPPGDRAALDEHLAGCAECRQRYGAAQRLVEGLRALQPLAPPTDLASRTAARVLRDRRRRLLRRRVGFALAASVLLAVAGYFGVQSVSAPQEAAMLVTAGFHVAPPPAPPPVLRQSFGDARQAFASILERLADGVKERAAVLQAPDVTMQFVSLDSLPRVGPLTHPLSRTAQGLQEGRAGVAAGVQILGGTGRRAFNYFLRKMPPSPPSK
jgi:hypothetical protein